MHVGHHGLDDIQVSLITFAVFLFHIFMTNSEQESCSNQIGIFVIKKATNASINIILQIFTTVFYRNLNTVQALHNIIYLFIGYVFWRAQN